MANQYTMNENGLTWQRWWAAATFGVPKARQPVYYSDRMKAMRKAWRKGECPCDWAAAYA